MRSQYALDAGDSIVKDFGCHRACVGVPGRVHVGHLRQFGGSLGRRLGLEGKGLGLT